MNLNASGNIPGAARRCGTGGDANGQKDTETVQSAIKGADPE